MYEDKRAEILAKLSSGEISVETLVDLYLMEHEQVLGFRDAQGNMAEWVDKLRRVSDHLEGVSLYVQARSSEVGHVARSMVQPDAVKRFEAIREYICLYFNRDKNTEFIEASRILDVPYPGSEDAYFEFLRAPAEVRAGGEKFNSHTRIIT
jgi:hypothetical protein